VIRRLLGLMRPRARIILWDTPSGVKRVDRAAAQVRRGLAFALWATAALLLAGFGTPRLTDREIGPTQRVSVGELRVWAERSQPPLLTATAFLAYDLESDRVLLAQNSQMPLPPASLTKLMTALLVLEQADLRAAVTVEPADLIGDATMGLQAGDTLTVTDLLWGLLVPSGNDAALALARHVGGSFDGFVALMNTRAQELGLEQTHFANPNGFDAEEHMSSAADLLRLTRELWDYPLFRTIVGTDTTTVMGRELRNTNEWLTRFEGVTGVKTGTTDEAKECLIAAVERDGHTVFLVLLGSRERYLDAERLYAAYEAVYTWQTLDGRELSVLNRMLDATGQLRFVQPTGAAPTVLQHEPGVPEVLEYRRLQIPAGGSLTAGTPVGALEWWVGPEMVGSQLLVVR
jgi:D-alanyl-D-alanine carboxypeptidase